MARKHGLRATVSVVGKPGLQPLLSLVDVDAVVALRLLGHRSQVDQVGFQMVVAPSSSRRIPPSRSLQAISFQYPSLRVTGVTALLVTLLN